MAAVGRNGGAWNGMGLPSTVAKNHDFADGAESVQLAVANNGDLGVSYGTWLGGETLGHNDIIVKYTYTGDLNLDGQVNAEDYNLLTNFSDQGTTSQNEWAFGDLNGDGKLNATDYNDFLNYCYGNGTNGVLGGNDPYTL